MQIKDVPRLTYFFRLKTSVNHLGYMLYIRTVCCFERGCKFVGINFHSTTKLVKIHDWIVWNYSFLVYF